MKKIILSAVSVIAGIATLALASCTGGATTAQAEFIINNGAEPASLDPAHVEGVPEHRLSMALFEGLTVNDPKTSRPLPGLAEKWSFNETKDVVTFTLRDTVWSDGTPITAQDLVDSWVRKLDPKEAAQYADLLYVIKGAEEYNKGTTGPEGLQVKALDKLTFQVTLVGPTPHFPAMAAHYAFGVVPMHAIKKFGADWIKVGNFVGNGPFTLKEWTPQEKIVVVPNPKYWDAANVGLSKITFLPIEDVNTSYQLYKAGQADWIEQPPVDLMAEVKLDPNFDVAPEYGTYYFIPNITRKPLDNPDVRKALSMAFDRQALVEKVTQGGQIPATGFVPPSNGYTPAAGYAFDVAKAKELLAKAGFPEGAGFPTFKILYNTSANHQRIAEFIQEEWKKNLGINVELVNQEWSTFLDTRSQSHDFDIARSGWIGDYLDPSTFTDMFITGGTQNDGLYSNAKYDELIKRARTQEGDARLATLMEAEKILIDEDMAVIPVYYYVTQNLINKSKWEGWYGNPLNVHPWKFIKPAKK